MLIQRFRYVISYFYEWETTRSDKIKLLDEAQRDHNKHKQAYIKFSRRFQHMKLLWWSRRKQMQMSTETTRRIYGWDILDHISLGSVQRIGKNVTCAGKWFFFLVHAGRRLELTLLEKAKNMNALNRKIMMKISKFWTLIKNKH